MSANSAELPLSKTQDLIVQHLEDELLVYNLKTNRALSLNKTSTLVWEMCDGKTGFSEIAEKLSWKLNENISKEFVWLAVEQLKKENLLENADKSQVNFEGLPRREVIKKVGLASAVALPMICAIVAPTAANAQSSSFVRVGGTCSQDSQCASNNCIGVCCANSTGTRVPGAAGPSFAACRDTNAQCAADFSAGCCSGSASITSDTTFCFFGYQCVCDPYPV